MTSLVSCCTRIVNQNKWPTLLHDRADVTSRYCTEKLNLKNISYWHYFTTKIMSICPIWNFTLLYVTQMTKSSFFWKSPKCCFCGRRFFNFSLSENGTGIAVILNLRTKQTKCWRPPKMHFWQVGLHRNTFSTSRGLPFYG